MIWNPAPHIHHAWTDAKTVWGKIALFLFYSLIWTMIVTSLWAIVSPTSQGNACTLNQVKSNETTDKMFTSLVRGLKVFAVGFYSYADVGGLKVKNVVMVAVFTVAFVLAMSPLYSNAQAEHCSAMVAQMWILPSWANA